MRGATPTRTRILVSAAASLTVGLGAASVVTGFSTSPPVRLIQGVAVFAGGAIVFVAVVVLILTHLARWREPESEEEFEAIVRRVERFAAEGRAGRSWDLEEEPLDEWVGWGQPWPGLPRARETFDELDDTLGDDREFRALVRAAIDDLPLEFHRALEHVAIVVSDDGWRRRAYGLYEGDTVARDFFHDRIVIFRDTLTRDFGHDPELLGAQVRRTLRHELAHHLGWGERGVRGLGL
ncbi:MAG: metallopeptidase family protein [Solirubrobacteraceae bacterium]